MQIAYHRICTEELNLLVKKCVQDIGLGGGQSELLQSLASLYIQTPSESAISQSEQGRSSDKNTEKPLDKSPTATSPKSQSKSRASGFFSLFGKRSTSSEARSSFYVNNPNKSSNANPIEQKSSHLTPAIVPLDFPRSPTTSVSPEHEQTPKEYSPCRIVDDEGMPRGRTGIRVVLWISAFSWISVLCSWNIQENNQTGSLSFSPLIKSSNFIILYCFVYRVPCLFL